jgi:hypothetical protein
MKEFFNKYKKPLIIILIILLLLGILLALYFLVFKDMISNTSQKDDTNISQEDETGVTPMPEYDERSGLEAILATYELAKEWSIDAQLYDCSGLTFSSVDMGDIVYEYIGADDGKYAQWLCTYYSDSKDQTRIYTYDEGVVEDDSEAMDTGEYGYLMYGNVDYPSDLESIVDSTEIYTKVVENGYDDANYLNMYVTNTSDYGFVWKVDERSKSEVDEYDTPLLVNTYVFDLYTGALKTISQEDIY